MEVLLLDEPTSALDKETELEIFKTITKVSNYVTVITVSHNRGIISYIDHAFLIENKRLMPVAIEIKV